VLCGDVRIGPGCAIAPGESCIVMENAVVKAGSVHRCASAITV
jgi:hypothetical protein